MWRAHTWCWARSHAARAHPPRDEPSRVVPRAPPWPGTLALQENEGNAHNIGFGDGAYSTKDEAQEECGQDAQKIALTSVAPKPFVGLTYVGPAKRADVDMCDGASSACQCGPP